jgi:hypothetical protein
MSNSREVSQADQLLWWGVGVFVAGRVVDLVWHATHPEFETAADQESFHGLPPARFSQREACHYTEGISWRRALGNTYRMLPCSGAP